MADTKDWTWVLERACPECGFDATALDREDVGTRLLQAVGALRAVLDLPDVAQRPAPDIWSPLEYICHVRDVCVVFDERLRLMLTTEDPVFPNWDQDATAVEKDYPSEEPALVAHQLWEYALVLAARFNGVTGNEWDRIGARTDGAHFTVASLGQYLVHDPVHHVFDVTGLRQGPA